MNLNNSDQWSTIFADFIRWEGKISHLYLDTRGLVTVGIGKMLPNIGSAQALGFVRRADGGAATPAEIAADFTQVSAQTHGLKAASYRPFTRLDLPDPEIAALLKVVVAGFADDLAHNFAGFPDYPDPVQRALLDMIYNLGLAGLLQFRKLKAAVEARRWAGAAAECHRNGPSQARNYWTRELFLSAIGSAKNT